MGKILVLGASGLVGSRFVDLYHAQTPTITPKSKELDITDFAQVKNFFDKNNKKFDSVVNFVGHTNVDEAERERGDEKGMVWKMDVTAAENVAKMCQKYGKYMVYISTDFVFPGSKQNPGPYSEDAKLTKKPSELLWYGWTKVAGERAVAKTTDKHSIVRIAYPFRAHFTPKLDFARSILSMYDEGKLYPMFSDQQFTPTFIDEAVKVIYLLVEEQKSGIFHATTSPVTTPHEFASYLIEKARGKKKAVKKGSIVEFLKAPGRTPKPVYGGLTNKKTKSKLGIKLFTWREAIDELVKQLG